MISKGYLKCFPLHRRRPSILLIIIHVDIEHLRHSPSEFKTGDRRASELERHKLKLKFAFLSSIHVDRHLPTRFLCYLHHLWPPTIVSTLTTRTMLAQHFQSRMICKVGVSLADRLSDLLVSQVMSFNRRDDRQLGFYLKERKE